MTKEEVVPEIRTLSRTRLWIYSATTMIRETLSPFQKNKKPTFKVPLWIKTTAIKANMTRHKNSVPLFNVKYGYFKSCLFPSTVIQ